MDKNQSSPGMKSDLAKELTETLSTLTRLGITLVNLPITLLPDKERQKAKELTDEALRIGGTLPRTIGTMLEGIGQEWQSGKKQREDLGSRLRRERQKTSTQKKFEDQSEMK